MVKGMDCVEVVEHKSWTKEYPHKSFQQSIWDIHDACAKHIHMLNGEVIILDSQPFSVV